MLLNYQFNEISSTQTPIVFIHGLFGSLSNLGMLARHFSETRSVIQIDVRNHGRSGHSEILNYNLMASDVLDTLDSLDIQKFIVIGHSMGGKIAAKIADFAPARAEKLVVLDMTPIQYHESHHTQIFKALRAVQQAQVSSRSEAITIMREFISEDMVIQFLLKSFNKGEWLFNVDALFEHYSDILDWQIIEKSEVPALFLHGGNSFYTSKPEHFKAIESQFRNAKIELIEDAGHWLHAEKTAQVLAVIDNFLTS